jgi:Tfp pilus assembly protein PilF
MICLLRAPVLGVVLLAAIGCTHKGGLPEPGSKEYQELVRAFYTGLAGLEIGQDVRAKEGLTLATQIAPGEPAAWANLGLLALQQQELDLAWQDMDKARALAPSNSRIEFFLGDIESRRGKLPEAIQHFKRAVDLDPGNLKALYSLAGETERQGTGASEGQALQLLKKILDRQPENAAVLLDVARLAARRGDTDTLKQAVARLVRESSSWPEDAKQEVKSLEQAALGPNPRDAALRVAFLRNVLLRVPGYRQSASAVKTPAVFAGEPFAKFLKLPSPSSDPAEPDLKMSFEPQAIAGAPQGPVYWVRAVYLDDSGKPSILWADGAGVHIPGGATLATPGGVKAWLAAADLNYDFKTDLVLAGPGGVRIYQQQDASHFVDITARTRLPKDIVNGSYTGAWPFDVDLDGDLDVVLGVTGGPPVVLRNNADGTFATVRPFSGNAGLVSFASADIDGDGDPDAAMIGQDGRLSVFMNERLGRFVAREVPQIVAESVAAVTAADIDSDGYADFIVLKKDGTVVRLSDKNEGRSWDTAELVKAKPAGADVLVADIDNNGSLDLLVGGGEVFLGSAHGFSRLDTSPAMLSASAIDLDADGRLDLLGVSKAGTLTELRNHGTTNYHWQTIRTRAANSHGDQRINSFGIGGEIEIRAGLLTQKQIITSPVLHFGLGDHTGTDLARIIWPNGLVQAEFDLKADQSVLAPQRLKGSCPQLFAWDGKQMSFVKDGAPWSPALGLHINAQQVAGIYQTREWFKIPGKQLAAHDGYYDVRVTAELWEVFYIDSYSLLAVDHPPGTEIFSDERFSNPPPALKVYTTTALQPFSKATDDNGRDVSEIVRTLDQKYLDTFGRGQYQGVARDHWVELELPDNAPRIGPLYLIADGWIHPTDGTTNVAMGQTSNPPARGLRIEVPDSKGRWIVAHQGLGFPAGKLKTSILDLTNIFQPNAPRKLRLGTNLEIYWDRLAWASGLPNDLIKTQESSLARAELRHRGFSVMEAANPSSPELPDYNRIEGTGQKWRDLEGYYTRFGDIRELLEKVDDRMVIMNAGDEIRLRFSEQPPPPPGWIRDYIMIGDGWIKDGDYNSTFSKTVLPLPYHGMKDYTIAPGRLEDDPAYQRNPGDWMQFHTRYVTPDAFRHGVMRVSK